MKKPVKGMKLGKDRFANNLSFWSLAVFDFSQRNLNLEGSLPNGLAPGQPMQRTQGICVPVLHFLLLWEQRRGNSVLPLAFLRLRVTTAMPTTASACVDVFQVHWGVGTCLFVCVCVSALRLFVGTSCTSPCICLCGYVPDCVGELPVAFWCHSQAAPTAKGTLCSGKLLVREEVGKS